MKEFLTFLVKYLIVIAFYGLLLRSLYDGPWFWELTGFNDFVFVQLSVITTVVLDRD